MIWRILCNRESMWHSPLGAVLNAERNCFYWLSVGGKIREPLQLQKTISPSFSMAFSQAVLVFSPTFMHSPVDNLEASGFVGFDHMVLWGFGTWWEIYTDTNLDTYIHARVWTKYVSCITADGIKMSVKCRGTEAISQLVSLVEGAQAPRAILPVIVLAFRDSGCGPYTG